jgi:hypothetical protein
MKTKTVEQVSRDLDALFVVVPPTPEPEKVEPPTSPTIDAHPEDLSVSAGQKACFSVKVSGTVPFQYQWRKNGNPVRTITSTYCVSDFSEELPDIKDNGVVFDVIITNGAGSTTSNSATLTVKEAERRTVARVLRSGALDCSWDEMIRIMAIPKSLVNEARRVEKQRLEGTFDFDKQFRKIDDECSFQRCGFAHSLREYTPGSPSGKQIGKNRKSHRGANADGASNDDLANLFAGMSKTTIAGTRFISAPGDPGILGIRKETPTWMQNEKDFRDFIRWHVATKTGKEIASLTPGRDDEKIIKAAGLDYTILTDYYLYRMEDKTIFEEHRTQFSRERGRQRNSKTSSPEAVKMRRIRLVEKGNYYTESMAGRKAA